jgi:hypothetical protein
METSIKEGAGVTKAQISAYKEIEKSLRDYKIKEMQTRLKVWSDQRSSQRDLIISMLKKNNEHIIDRLGGHSLGVYITHLLDDTHSNIIELAKDRRITDVTCVSESGVVSTTQEVPTLDTGSTANEEKDMPFSGVGEAAEAAERFLLSRSRPNDQDFDLIDKAIKCIERQTHKNLRIVYGPQLVEVYEMDNLVMEISRKMLGRNYHEVMGKEDIENSMLAFEESGDGSRLVVDIRSEEWMENTSMEIIIMRCFMRFSLEHHPDESD